MTNTVNDSSVCRMLQAWVVSVSSESEPKSAGRLCLSSHTAQSLGWLSSRTVEYPVEIEVRLKQYSEVREVSISWIPDAPVLRPDRIEVWAAMGVQEPKPFSNNWQPCSLNQTGKHASFHDGRRHACWLVRFCVHEVVKDGSGLCLSGWAMTTRVAGEGTAILGKSDASNHGNATRQVVIGKNSPQELGAGTQGVVNAMHNLRRSLEHVSELERRNAATQDEITFSWDSQGPSPEHEMSEDHHVGNTTSPRENYIAPGSEDLPRSASRSSEADYAPLEQPADHSMMGREVKKQIIMVHKEPSEQRYCPDNVMTVDEKHIDDDATLMHDIRVLTSEDQWLAERIIIKCESDNIDEIRSYLKRFVLPEIRALIDESKNGSRKSSPYFAAAFEEYGAVAESLGKLAARLLHRDSKSSGHERSLWRVPNAIAAFDAVQAFLKSDTLRDNISVNDLKYIVSRSGSGLAAAVVRRLGDHNSRISWSARDLALLLVSLCGADALLPCLSPSVEVGTPNNAEAAAEDCMASLQGLSASSMTARIETGLAILDMCQSDGSVQLDHVFPLAIAGLRHSSGDVRKDAIELATKLYEMFGDGFLNEYEEFWQRKVPSNVGEVLTRRFVDIYESLQDYDADEDLNA
ncbi:hypothetical protein FOL47_006551 [Perkinsus chesapeaki]|uniref:Uncharacterized protein n=1 Tax=Perkinsus chesapeaki TaxID=330153 RepID=A0A7J6LS69_PERCH|nr:hypothetical protein FOL47_006551 [Perkinsus chesapeaki]